LDELTRYFLYIPKSIKNINILTKNRLGEKDYQKFLCSLEYYKKENKDINVCIKFHSKKSTEDELLRMHMRMIIINDTSVYNIGASLDGRPQKCDSIIEFDKKEVLIAIDQFVKLWESATEYDFEGSCSESAKKIKSSF
jgi:hypothetical protein